MRRLVPPTLLLLLCPLSCTKSGPTLVYRDVLIAGVPHVKQKPDLCGEACAEMFLRKLGLELDQDYVFEQCATDPEQERGCYTAELSSGLRKIGFRVGKVWQKVASTAPSSDAELEEQWRALHADLLAGVPSIVCTHYDESPTTTEHFRLVLGYSAKTDEVIYHEPAEANGAYRRMKRPLFLRLWPLKYEPARWTVIRLRLESGPALRGSAPARRPAASRPAGPTAAELGRHVAALRPRVPEGFTVVVQSPFVVIGDEPAERVLERAQSTVKWAVDKLKQSYFSRDPTEIIDIWLLRDRESYLDHTWRLFHERPSTPYGYYSATHRALTMNIATGGGTLVHEIVHPYMRANFPRSPPWFNEGLGSLYEQSGEAGGKIVGYPNWRLPGLQQALRAGRVPSFRSLTAMNDQQFYVEDRGTNYAQARYLCYYLQQRGLLLTFYRDFVASQAEDPTGYRTLQRVLREPDMEAFQRRWATFVLGLRFPADE